MLFMSPRNLGLDYKGLDLICLMNTRGMKEKDRKDLLFVSVNWCQAWGLGGTVGKDEHEHGLGE